MIIKAQQKFIRTSARKIRLVVDSVNNLTPSKALEQLEFSPKTAANKVAKVIKQALANAVNNLNIEKENLLFDNIQVGEGPTYKRWRAVSRGRAHQILKRTSHLTVTLKTKSEDNNILKKTNIQKTKKSKLTKSRKKLLNKK